MHLPSLVSVCPRLPFRAGAAGVEVLGDDVAPLRRRLVERRTAGVVDGARVRFELLDEHDHRRQQPRGDGDVERRAARCIAPVHRRVAVAHQRAQLVWAGRGGSKARGSKATHSHTTSPTVATLPSSCHYSLINNSFAALDSSMQMQ